MTAVPDFPHAHSPEASSEQQLIDQASRGSAEAFGELVRRYQQPVRGFVARQIFDAAAADDIAQEVFLGAMQMISGLNQHQSFRGWLLSIARNKCIDHLRRKARRRPSSSGPIEQLLAAEALARYQPNDPTLVDQPDVLHALQQCLQQLSPTSRHLVNEIYFESRSTQQLAVKLNKKPGTIRMALLRIRQKLARCMGLKLGEDITT